MAAQKVTKISLAELYKRVPPNQIQKYFQFCNKNAQYKKRVDKYPEFLPKIDWDYYRSNVRSEYCKMVEDFEKKYEELNKVFDCRHQLDTAKYFKEVDEQRIAVKSEVEAYIADSNKRIKAYEDEIERIKSMVPYEQMTCEEFVIACPDKASLLGCGQEPSFWPHDPDEQTPGPANPQIHEKLRQSEELEEPVEEPEIPKPTQTSPPTSQPSQPPSTSATPPSSKSEKSSEAEDTKAMIAEAKKVAAEVLKAVEARSAEGAKEVTEEVKKEADATEEAASKEQNKFAAKLADKDQKVIQAELRMLEQEAAQKQKSTKTNDPVTKDKNLDPGKSGKK